MVSFTDAGKALMDELCKKLAGAGVFSETANETADVSANASAEGCEELSTWAEAHFQTGNVLVFIGACGIAVRTIAPLVTDKTKDPAVLVIDEKGNTVIPILSGHIGGGVEAADMIAELLHAKAIHTTASDVNGLFAVDVFASKKNLTINDLSLAKSFTANLLKTRRGICVIESEFTDAFPELINDLPEEISLQNMPNHDREKDTDLSENLPKFILAPTTRCADTLQLIPKCIVAGMGCRKGKSIDELYAFMMASLAQANIDPAAVCAIATSDVKREEAGLIALAEKLGVPLVTFSAEELMAQTGDFDVSEFVEKVTGSDNVCERAVAAYGCKKMLVKKQAENGMTFAAGLVGAQTAKKKKQLYIVGIGPGNRDDMTVRALKTLAESTVIAGYTVYCDLVRPLFPEKKYISTTMTKEEERVKLAFDEANTGAVVSIVCSGDAGVYGLAGLAFSMAENYPDVEVSVIPGVTAALSGAAILGAPLIHDFCVISLSDRLTPWETIEKRLRAAAEADLSIVIYNPESKSRSGYLKRACEILLEHVDGSRVCGVARNIAREGESREVMTLSELSRMHVDMFSTVFIGNSTTENIADHMVTPRGYRQKNKE